MPTVVLLALLAGACGSPGLGRWDYLPWGMRSDLPPPGRCSLASGRAIDREDRDCDDLEGIADPGQIILFRPTDGSGQIVVCHMDPLERGLIDAVEVFDINTGELVEVIQRHGEPPPAGGCQNALWAWLERTGDEAVR